MGDSGLLASLSLDCLDGRKKEPKFVVRVRGLPYSCCGAEVLEFFSDHVNIVNGEAGVHFTLTKEGRPSGEAYIELESDGDVAKAVKMDRQLLQGRYIEIFKSTSDEMDYVLEKAERQANQPWDNVIRLRGIPFKCTPDKLRTFFKDMEIPINGILLLTDQRGRNTGDGFVQFNSHEHAEQALLKHKESIDRRYIEIFKASRHEMNEAGNRMRGSQFPLDNPGRKNLSLVGVGPDGVYCHLVQMRGLPFRATDEDIRAFFAPTPISACQFEFGYDSRPTGRASVAFPSHKEALKAMERDKQTIGNRYIELFLKSVDCPPLSGIGANGHYLYMLQMRGLPFKVTPKDICNFFAPIRILDCNLEMGPNGPNGAGKVAFYTQEDCKSAQKKDKEHIGDRYIELFQLKAQKPHSHRF